MKKKSNKDQGSFVLLHIHGIFDKKSKQVTKVSLDKDEIDMELALAGSTSTLVECEFDVSLFL